MTPQQARDKISELEHEISVMLPKAKQIAFEQAILMGVSFAIFLASFWRGQLTVVALLGWIGGSAWGFRDLQYRSKIMANKSLIMSYDLAIKIAYVIAHTVVSELEPPHDAS